jgi:EAL domain-containing protein (putative c-di-GMP-specific phosphodiesterase class I)
MYSIRQRIGRPRRPTLLLAFGVITAACVAFFAVVAGRLMHDTVHDQALRDAQRMGEVFVELALHPDDFKGGELTEQGLGHVREAVERSSSVLSVQVWDRSAKLLYSSEPLHRARGLEPNRLGTVLAGDVSLRQTTVGDAGLPTREHPGEDDLLDVMLPVRPERAGGRPLLAVQLEVSYAPVRRQIADGTRDLYGLLGIVALFLYFSLLPLVFRASRAMTEAHARRNAGLQRDLRRAMARGDLVPYFQPKIDMQSRRVVGVEALVRWIDPDRGVVPPGDFLPQAEHTDVMRPLTRYIAERAFADVARWSARGLRLDVSVNLSAHNLHEADLADDMAALAAQHGLDPGAVTFEITETAAMQAETQGALALERLRAVGFKLSIDDFGTGFSSLARLDQLPLDELKIDRRFISATREGVHTLVPTIVKLARDLGLRTVAEGVESQDTADWLREVGCDHAQGFLYSPPLPAVEVERLVERLGGAAEHTPRAPDGTRHR